MPYLSKGKETNECLKILTGSIVYIKGNSDKQVVSIKGLVTSVGVDRRLSIHLYSNNQVALR